jgi:tRNA (guanine-N7-)-methyltransferase
MARGLRSAAPYDDPPRLPEGDEVDVRSVLVEGDALELEIGPGRGAFILERSATSTSVAILGIEIRRKWACVVDGRLAERGVGARARVLCEDARLALPRLGPEGVLARVFIHFPDPWWKKRHEKRMVVGDPLLAQIARLLRDDGELFIQTDVPERAQQYRTHVDAQPAFAAAGDEPDTPVLSANPYGARSNRERRADEDGLPVYRLRYRRRAR